MNLLTKIWRDEVGFVVSSELVLLTVIIVIGMIVGMSTMRDQVVQEFGDLGLAVGALNQSYSFSGATLNGFTVAGSSFADQSDDCDGADPTAAAPACIDLTITAAAGE